MREEIFYFNQFYDNTAPVNIHMIGKSYCDKDYIIFRPNSNIFSIEYTSKGEGILEKNGEKFEIEKNDTYFLFKNECHKYYTKSTEWEKIWIVYEGSVIDNLFHAYLHGDVHRIKNFNIGQYLKELFDLAKNRAPYSEIASLAALSTHKILIKAAQSQESPSPSLPEQIKNYIDENITDAFSLKRLCGEFNYSKNHIVNVFKGLYNITPHIYYAQKRLTLIKDYLKNTNLSIESIALDLNFGSANYLTSFFTEKSGTTPTEFRANS